MVASIEKVENDETFQVNIILQNISQRTASVVSIFSETSLQVKCPPNLKEYKNKFLSQKVYKPFCLGGAF